MKRKSSTEKNDKAVKGGKNRKTDSSSNKSTSDQECPVCTEKFRDARVLDCGHHFCRVCLEKIATKLKDGHVKCPACRHVTKIGGPEHIKHLKRYRIVNDFVTTVKSMTALEPCMKDARVSKNCEMCYSIQGAKLATKCCFLCHALMCDGCHNSKHKNLGEIHERKTFTLSPLIYCQRHEEKFNIFLCKTCDSSCCGVCSVTEHKGHDLDMIEEAGTKIRKKLVDLEENILQSCNQEDQSKRVKFLLDYAKEKRLEFTNGVNDILKRNEEFRCRLMKSRDEVTKTLDSEIKMLEMMNHDFIDFLNSKKILLEHIERLQSGVSDQELVVRGKELHKFDFQLVQEFMHTSSVKIPEIHQVHNIRHFFTDIAVVPFVKNLTYEIVNYLPLEKLTEVTSICAMPKLYGMAVDTKMKRLIVRRQDIEEPIAIYDYKGRKISSVKFLGENFSIIIAYQSIAIDTHRNLIMVPIINGTLLLMDFMGKVTKTIKFCQSTLHGVAYMPGKDLYILSSAEAGEVYLYNPNTQRLIPDFKISVPLKGPYFVSAGNFECDGTTSEHIFVTCHSDHCVKVFDPSGKHVKTYGIEGEQGGALDHLNIPQGTLAAFGKELIVVDCGNSRLISFPKTSEANPGIGRQLSESKDMLVQRALNVDYDPNEGTLFLGFESGMIKIFKG